MLGWLRHCLHLYFKFPWKTPGKRMKKVLENRGFLNYEGVRTLIKEMVARLTNLSLFFLRWRGPLFYGV
jgi:hypothetical protein